MCSLLLLHVAKRADLEFETPHRSSCRTTRSAEGDISKLESYLIEEGVIQENENRGKILFQDPLEAGMQKIVDGGWTNFYIPSSQMLIPVQWMNQRMKLKYNMNCIQSTQ